MNALYRVSIALLYTLFFVPLSWADGIPVDKVYSPYVLANERELEWRFTSRQNDDGNVLAQRLAYGHAVSEYLTIEAYIVGERDDTGDFGLQAYEIETRWMLTEQGELWADWGVLFELEKQHKEDIYEFTSGILFEKEFTQTSLTINALLVYEWGKDIQDEFETEFRLKYRYRYLAALQPSIEIYTGEDFVGVGPGFMGVHRYAGQKQLKWELAFIAGLNGDSKDHTLRFALEYEF
ncbi:hypothetical protein [uncultured Paraglaciecola sp.]|uniref:hypothetical protein n=1 Tax=uncultured Paraglaciecola sp. TaxID=1765024 RepID=UPI0030D6E216|tara:strand:- start:67294 stop:68001 length:708 start_codon:yes stop_codon:yes gene_type:complete